jgi:hypothetical protein
MTLAPTTPSNPAQRIDRTFVDGGKLIEEMVWAWPFDGSAIRRREGQADEPVTGLPIPQPEAPTADDRLATLLGQLATAATLDDVQAAALAAQEG